MLSFLRFLFHYFGFFTFVIFEFLKNYPLSQMFLTLYFWQNCFDGLIDCFFRNQQNDYHEQICYSYFTAIEKTGNNLGPDTFIIKMKPSKPCALALSGAACGLTGSTQALFRSVANFEMGCLTLVKLLSSTFSLTSDKLTLSSNDFFSISINVIFLLLSVNCCSSSWLCSNLRQFSCSLSFIDNWYCLSSSSWRRFTQASSCHFSPDYIVRTVDVWQVEADLLDLYDSCFLLSLDL